jgi:Predicted membrane protein (DUF2306)
MLRSSGLTPKPWKWLLWAALVVLSAWYLVDNVLYAFLRDRTDETLLRTSSRFVHLFAAVPLLLLAPLQFSRRVRLRWPRWHRRVGQFYLVAALIGALLAIHLGMTIKYEGSRIPLALFGCVWLGFSVAAWVCARRRDFVTHERFMIRGYVLAMAFVWVRMMYDFQHEIFPFIGDVAVRDTTREWLSFVAPLLVVETWLSWWPALRVARNRQ